MAGDWIKVQKSTPNDPRIVRMASALKADRYRILGGTIAAWILFDEHTDDGMIIGYTPEILDELIGFAGLAKAMESVGWLEIGDNYLKVPGFEQHNGQSAKRRARDSVRKTSARKADKLRTREEKRREEKNIHSHPQAKEFAKEWTRWCEFRYSVDGRHIPEVQADSILMELHRRGPEKAKRDIDFSIQKGARSILDSDNDFGKQRSKPKAVDLGI